MVHKQTPACTVGQPTFASGVLSSFDGQTVMLRASHPWATPASEPAVCKHASQRGCSLWCRDGNVASSCLAVGRLYPLVWYQGWRLVCAGCKGPWPFISRYEPTSGALRPCAFPVLALWVSGQRCVVPYGSYVVMLVCLASSEGSAAPVLATGHIAQYLCAPRLLFGNAPGSGTCDRSKIVA